MKLTNPTDDQLNAAFAEKVAGWTFWKLRWSLKALPKIERCGISEAYLASCWTKEDDADKEMIIYQNDFRRFTTSADAVLPWLEKYGWSFEEGTVWVSRLDNAGEAGCGGDNNECRLPLATKGLIAILRAHGVEVEFVEINKD